MKIPQTQHLTISHLSVFIASMLEAIGLYPVIIIVQGHAFPGCYLTENHFSSCEQNIANLFEKLTAKQLVIFDSSSSVNKGVSFEDAQKKALAYLGDFDLLIDIKASHKNGFWPLDYPFEENQKASKEPPAKELMQPNIQEQKRLGAIEKFKIKLLNLSNKNPLINYGAFVRGNEELVKGYENSKTSIFLGSNNFGHFFKEFVQGGRFIIDSNFSNWELVDHYLDQTVFAIPSGDKEFSLVSLLPQPVLVKRIKNIRSQITYEINQSGRSTFLLGLGMVRYFEDNENVIVNYAPLLLLSVRVLKDANSGKAVIECLPDSLQPNITLFYKLATIAPDLELMGLYNQFQKGSVENKFEWFFDQVNAILLCHEGFRLFGIAVLDFFPFSSFLMLQELEQDYESLSSHPLMKEFLEINRDEIRSGKECEEISDESDRGFVEADFHFNEDFLLVERADSTQIRAIKGSLEGESFVLEGPPGTGKTTTLTNIVALNLLKGKKILFVAEKSTAIDQLYKGLAKCGLDKTILKIEAKKDGNELVRELAASLSLERPEIFAQQDGRLIYTIERWQENSAILANLKEILAKPCILENYAYKILSNTLKYDEKSFVDFDCEDILSYDIKWYLKARDNLQNYFNCPQKKLPKNLFLKNINRCHQTDLNEVSKVVCLIERNLPILQDLASILNDSGLNGTVKIDDLRTANQILCKKQDAAQNQIYPSLILKPGYKTTFHRTRQFLVNKTRQEQNRADILRVFHEKIISDQDFASLKEGFDSYYAAPNMVLKLWYIRFKNEIQDFLKNQGTDDRKISETLRLVADYRAKVGQLNREKDNIKKLWRDFGFKELDFDSLGKIMDEAESFANRSAQDSVAIWQNKIVLLPESEKASFIEKANSSISRLYGCFGQLRKMLDLEVCSIFNVESLNELGIDKIVEFCSDFRANFEFIEEKIVLNSYLAPLLEQNLGDFVEKVDGQNCSASEVLELFDASFYRLWYKNFRNNNPEILNFQRYVFDQKRKEFENADNALLDLAPVNVSKRIFNDIFVKTQNHFQLQKNYLLGLQNLKAIRISFRKILQELGFEFVSTLKPCLMINPTSVPEKMPLDFGPFDMVIFDEASQIESAYAIGALRRAKQWIVAGDSKQLPPSKIKNAIKLDLESALETGPAGLLESLLDECRRSLGKIHWLEWHYRSKDESLITFSNDNFYNGRLVTFPGADSGGGFFGVDYHKMNGGYIPTNVSNGGGTNPDEAQFIVNYLLDCIRDPIKRKRSYGVITTNSSQAELVMKKLAESFSREEKEIFLDEEGIGIKFTAEGSYEPIWVKPISQVQGDERDVVLVTTVMSTNRIGGGNGPIAAFGILAEQGAERRLNVAFTRAREKMVVVTSMLSTDITPKATNLGPHYLRSFLGFLELRNSRNQEEKSLAGKQKPVDYEKLEPLVRDITRRLIDCGYLVENYIGNSSYKIEIAVRSPEDPDKYLLAVETDGEIYQKALSARDREILRPQILKMFGWGDIYRVWLLEYIKSPEKEIEKIVAAIESAKDRPTREPGFANKLIPESVSGIVAQDDEDLVAINEVPTSDNSVDVVNNLNDVSIEVGHDNDSGDLTNENFGNDRLENPSPEISTSVNIVEPNRPPLEIAPFKEYEKYSPDEFFSPDHFLDESQEGVNRLNSYILKIIEKESPLTFDTLKARLRDVYKIGKFVKDKPKYLVKRLNAKDLAKEIIFKDEKTTIWYGDSLKADNPSFCPRCICRDNRPFNQVPTEEIQRALYLIVEAAETISKEDLINEGIRPFKIQRKTATTIKAFSEAIEALKKQRFLTFNQQTLAISLNKVAE